ncbi:universal stress protein [Imperialibacter roseus]|uniref:Universal stress protein n=1 Tax=Imperialibacter roseus TaxID=1324217 RepID=A0ABZ0INZ5_9BACT|nr:universal stress protein [Imperialibacter roseus]WOK06237.1 universal stress protein [Imperialibacter roseus]|tara:strand:- start:1607 stop:2437 length:831 start_codon:yes stop_codon:yes gene_type:complete
MNIKNILVPTDFSPCSKNAVRIAVDLSKKLGAKIHLINAIHVPTPHMDIGGQAMIEPMLEEYEEEVDKKFDALDEEIPGLKDVKHDHRAYVSFTIDAIYTAMETKKIDMIVMGTKGSHDTLEKLLGGVSSEVIRIADVPVLVVPEAIKKFNPKKIVFAADFNKIESIGRLSPLKDIAELFEAEITIVNVTEDDKFPFSRLVESFKVDKFLKNIKHSFETTKNDDVRAGLFEFAEKNSADMIVMMPRKHSLFEKIFKSSVTKKVAMGVKVPLLTFHE